VLLFMIIGVAGLFVIAGVVTAHDGYRGRL
jgi:hypothetical protein